MMLNDLRHAYEARLEGAQPPLTPWPILLMVL